MRRLCGAIVTAGALVGLGLIGLGFGIRYAGFAEQNADGQFWANLRQVDILFLVILVFLMAWLAIGLRAALVGLADNAHYKRHLERVRDHVYAEQTRDTARGLQA